jgi:hypothetical protein
LRRAAKVDANQGRIVEALRHSGCWVWSLAGAGNGCPDLLVWRDGYHLLEVKDGSRPPSERRLTPAEERFHAQCPGPVYVVNSVAEALQAVGVFRRQAT